MGSSLESLHFVHIDNSEAGSQYLCQDSKTAPHPDLEILKLFPLP